MNPAGDIVRSHLRNGDFGLARVAAERLLCDAEPTDLGTLHALHALALVHLGLPDAAIEAAEAAAAHSDHWEVRLALGEAMVAVGQPVAGRGVLAEAHQALAQAQPGEDTVAGEILVGTALAEACRAAGDPETGVGVATRALAWAQRHRGQADPEAISARFALGLSLYGAGRFDQALVALEHVLSSRRRWHPDSLDVAGTLDAIGAVLRKQGKPFRAVTHHRQALALWEDQLGPHASRVGACRHSLAQALHRTGDFLAARAEMAHALRLTRHALGDDHVDTWITRFELGRYQVDVGEMEQGFQQMEAARAVVAQRLGRFHPVVQAMDRFL